MSDHPDTTPLGKSVEEVEGQPQRQHPDDGGVLTGGLNPDRSEEQNTTDAPVNMVTALEHSLGMEDENPRNPDADEGSSEE